MSHGEDLSVICSATGTHGGAEWGWRYGGELFNRKAREAHEGKRPTGRLRRPPVMDEPDESKRLHPTVDSGSCFAGSSITGARRSRARLFACLHALLALPA